MTPDRRCRPQPKMGVPHNASLSRIIGAAKLPVATVSNGSRFAGCRRSRVRRAEWQVPGRESVADRPQPEVQLIEMASPKLPFT